jgi:hypothetical protein
MDLKEKMQVIVDRMMKTKNEWVATKPENTDLGIMLHFYRGDDLVAAVECPLDRDLALQAAQIGSMGFNATTASIAFEALHALTMVSPLTGKEWMHQEMQYLFETNPNASEWVVECITVTMHERGGAYGLHSVPYTIEDDQVTWMEEHVVTGNSTDDDDFEGGGLMFRVMQEAMAGPTMEQKIAEAAKESELGSLMASLVTDEETRLFHTDMACSKALQQRELVKTVLLSAGEGSARKKLLTERLGPSDTES